MCFKVILVLCVSLKLVNLSPLVIRSGLSHLDDHKAHEVGNVFDAKTHAGIANYEADTGFNKDLEKKFVNAEDKGVFAEDEHKIAHKIDQAEAGKEQHHANGGDSVSNIGQKQAHKKGHHKQGFHNTYHKDESGSNSSFYDDSNDEGDVYSQDSKKNSYADSQNARNKNAYINDDAYNKENARKSNYANGGNYLKDNSGQRNYNNERYYNDQKQNGRNNAAKQHGNEGRRVAEEVHQHQPYYQGSIHGGIHGGSHGIIPNNRPIVHNAYGYNNYEEAPLDYYQTPYKNDYYDDRRITVYEDPSYERFGRNEQYRNNDYDQYYEPRLEVRAPTAIPYTHDRYDRRPIYNDNYYNY